MSGIFPDGAASSDDISMVLPDADSIAIDQWTSYSFNSDFLVPADAWTFTTGGQNLDNRILNALKTGARVLLKINGKTQGGGFIDKIEVRNDRGSGTTITIHGRDCFGPVVDAGADPVLYSFTSSQTLLDVVKAVFERSGFTQDSQFDISNDANRTIMTGVRTRTKGGKKGPRPLKAVKIARQLHPYPGEGLFAFLTRFLHRFGLWCWPNADQTMVIVGEPSYDQPPIQAIIRRSDGSMSNVIHGAIHEDATDQPSSILATGVADTGAEWSQSRLKVFTINELTGLDAEFKPRASVIGLYYSRNPDAFWMKPREKFRGYLGTRLRESPVARPMFLHDDEAKNLDELQRFVRKEMSLRQQRMWTGEYQVYGHTQGGVPWAVDTVVSLDDDLCDFHSPMYVRGRTFEKSPTGGTTTKLDLILPYTLSFGD